MANGRSPAVRAFLSIGSALSFLVLAVSGAALYTAPPCSIADSISWRFLFIGKESWEAIHICFAVSFLILAPLHLIFNWGIFTTYFGAKTAKARGISRPFLIAAISAVALFLMSAFHIPPVSWIHDAHEKLKFSWFRDTGPGDGTRGKGLRKIQNSRRGGDAIK